MNWTVEGLRALSAMAQSEEGRELLRSPSRRATWGAPFLSSYERDLVRGRLANSIRSGEAYLPSQAFRGQRDAFRGACPDPSNCANSCSHTECNASCAASGLCGASQCGVSGNCGGSGGGGGPGPCGADRTHCPGGNTCGGTECPQGTEECWGGTQCAAATECGPTSDCGFTRECGQSCRGAASCDAGTCSDTCGGPTCGLTCGAASCAQTCGTESCIGTCKPSCAGGTCANSCNPLTQKVMDPAMAVINPGFEPDVRRGVGRTREAVPYAQTPHQPRRRPF